MPIWTSKASLVSDIVVDQAIDMKGYGLTSLGATVFASGGYLQLEDSLADDLSYSGLTFIGTAGENLAQFQTVYRKNDSKYWLAKADDASTMPVFALALEAIAADATGLFLLVGWVRNDAWVLTAGQLVYQSAATAGLITNTQPAASGDQIQKVGVALTAKIGHFNPVYTVFELL